MRISTNDENNIKILPFKNALLVITIMLICYFIISRYYINTYFLFNRFDMIIYFI